MSLKQNYDLQIYIKGTPLFFFQKDINIKWYTYKIGKEREREGEQRDRENTKLDKKAANKC